MKLGSVPGGWLRAAGARAGAAAMVLAWLLAAGPGSAAGQAPPNSIHIELLHDEGLFEWDGVTNAVWAGGGVRVSFEETQIESVEFLYDGEEVAQFTGRVRFVRRGETLMGGRAVVNLRTGELHMTDVEGQILVDEFDAPVYLRAEELFSDETRLRIYGGLLTTCAPDERPGYHLAGREMEVIHGERVVLRHVRFVEQGIPLLYWPYLALSLDEFSGLQMPMIGYNSEEGWYVRVAYRYNPAGPGRGEVHVGLTQKRGVGVGVSHTYREGAGGEGRFRLYTRPSVDRAARDFEAGWEEILIYGPWRASFSAEHETAYWAGEAYRENDLRLSVQHERSAGSSEASVRYEAQQAPGSINTELRLRADHDQTLAGGWRYRLSGQAVQFREDDSVLTVEGFHHTLSWSRGPYRFDAAAERRPHSNRLEGGDPPWHERRRLPEVTFAYRPTLSLGPLRVPVGVEAGYAVLGETPRPPRAPVDVSRQSLDLRLRNWQFLQSSWQSATFGGGLTLQRYGSGEERVLLDSSFRHQLRLGRALTLETHYSYREPFGDPAPLDFDRVDASERVNETVRYQTPEVLASVTAGYDFRTQTPTDPRIRFRLTPGPAFRLDLHARYRLSESELEYIVGTAEWTPTEAVALKLGGKYLPAAGVFERADGVIELQHGPWSLSYGGIYRGLQGVFERGNLAVTRDLGCRAVTFFMNQTRQEYWFEYRITAVPLSRVRVGGGSEEGFIFDADVLQELLDL